jgi:hypothetical protein
MKGEGANHIRIWNHSNNYRYRSESIVDQKNTEPKPESPCGQNYAKNKNIGASEMRLFESFSVVVVQYVNQCIDVKNILKY